MAPVLMAVSAGAEEKILRTNLVQNLGDNLLSSFTADPHRMPFSRTKQSPSSFARMAVESAGL